MKLLLHAAILLSALSFGACSTDTRNPKGLYISSPDSYFVDSQGPSAKTFNQTIDKAISGDSDSLKYILSLSRFTDGEGSLSFGEKLLHLKKVVGSTQFNRSLDSLPEEIRRSAKIDIDSALSMRKFTENTN